MGFNIHMDPQKYTSKVSRRLFLQIAKNRVEMELYQNALLRLEREKLKIQILQVSHTYDLLLTQIRDFSNRSKHDHGVKGG